MNTRIKGPRPYGLSVDPDGPVSLPTPPPTPTPKPRRCDCEQDTCETVTANHPAGSCGLPATRRLVAFGHAALYCDDCAERMRLSGEVTSDTPARQLADDFVDGAILGVDRRSYPKEMLGAAPCVVDVTVVLVAGGIGDYAAYAGIGSDDFVARYGNKLSFAEAATHFPNALSADRYRP